MKIFGVTLLILALTACGDDDSDNDGGNNLGGIVGAMQGALQNGYNHSAAYADGFNRFLVAARSAEGSADPGLGVSLSVVGETQNVQGTVSVDLDGNETRETPLNVSFSGGLPADFSTGISVNVTGPGMDTETPLESLTVTVTADEEGPRTLAVTSGTFRSIADAFTTILFAQETGLTVSGDGNQITGQLGFEMMPSVGNFIFGRMIFEAAGPGYRIRVEESDGAFSYVID